MDRVLSVRAKSLPDIVSVPIPDRFAIIAAGFPLLVEHIATLRDSAQHLRDAGQPRAAAIIRMVMAEEAAKILILLDLARLGWEDQAAVRRQLKYFGDHVPRGIYVEVTSTSPASFNEVRQYAQMYQLSRYLDGPNDVDLIFRNRIESAREETLYVDYVWSEEGYRWLSPRDRESFSSWSSGAVTELVLAMDRVGLLSLRGLESTAREWSSAIITPGLGWHENVRRNQLILVDLWNEKAFHPGATDADVNLILERWTFPMGTLDLRKIHVTDEELDEERERIMRNW